jgi:hypothetical protein
VAARKTATAPVKKETPTLVEEPASTAAVVVGAPEEAPPAQAPLSRGMAKASHTAHLLGEGPKTTHLHDGTIQKDF